MTVTTPASEIIREAEKQLTEAQNMRLSAFNLLKEAAAIEENTRAYTIELMGPQNGLIAFEMARWSMAEINSASEIQFRANVTASTSAPASAPVSATPAAPVVKPKSVAVTLEKSDTRASSDKYFGENVPQSRISEADDILSQAAAYVSQGRKGNPFGSDRGKNAWRKSLFNAAYGHYASSQSDTVAGVVSDEEGKHDVETIANVIVSNDIPFFGDEVPSGNEQKAVNETTVMALEKSELEELTVEHSAMKAEFNEAHDSMIEDVFDAEELIESTEFDDVYTSDDIADDYLSSVNDDHSFGIEEVTDEFISEVYSEMKIETKASNVEDIELDKSEPDETAQHVEAVSEAKTDSVEVAEVDPFDDIGELPPANSAPPPRGLSSRPIMKGVSEIKPEPVVTTTAVVEERSSVSNGFARPSGGMGKPASVSSMPSSKSVETKVASPPAAKHEAPQSMPKAHTPMPIPPHRRPGNGQVLQQPETLPSAIANVNSGAQRPKTNSFSSPPSFMNRKA